MYNHYAGKGKDWNAVAGAVAIKLQTACDEMASGNVAQITLTIARHNKYYDGSSDVDKGVRIIDIGDVVGVAGTPLGINYQTVQVRALETLGDGQISVSYWIDGVGYAIAAMTLYINNESSRYRHNDVLEDVEIKDEAGDIWDLDSWYSSWLDAQQEQDITDSEQEDLDN